MFQSLRQNSQIYIFHKDKPFLEIGQITNVTPPKPKYPVPPTFGQAQEMVVDITAKVNDLFVNYTGLPAQQEIADSYSNNECIVISDNKEAMNAEILNFKQKSVDIINSVDKHTSIIEQCESILKELNPEFAEKEKQKLEIDNLKSQMTIMAQNMQELMETNKKLIEQLKGGN